MQVYDLSFIKKFTIREDWKLGFEGNFFQHFQSRDSWPPLAVLSDARFGRITHLAGTNPRQVQLALKLTF